MRQNQKTFIPLTAYYDLSSYLRPPKARPNLNKLFDFTKEIFSLHSLETDKQVTEVSKLLKSLLTEQSLSNAQKSWIESTMSSLLCLKCSASPASKSSFPSFLCQACLQNSLENSNCLICQIHYKNDNLNILCRHLCLFCACISRRKGKTTCPHCNYDFNSILSRSFTCDSCSIQNPESSKFLFEDFIYLLKCGHFLCGDCLFECIKPCKCPIDSVPISKRNRNYIINYLSSICSLCGTRKPWSKFPVRSCCESLICLKCQNDSSICKGCEQVLR